MLNKLRCLIFGHLWATAIVLVQKDNPKGIIVCKRCGKQTGPKA